MSEFPYKINEKSIAHYFKQYNVEESDIALYEQVDMDIHNGKRLTTSAKIITKLVEKYPTCSMFLNELFSIHAIKQDTKKMLFYAEQLWEKFPADLMSMILKAHYLLCEQDLPPLDIVKKIFNGMTFLNDMYPERTDFYPHEILFFHKLMMQLFAKNMDPKTALIHARIVSKIDYEDEDCLDLYMQFITSEEHLCELMDIQCIGDDCQSRAVAEEIKQMLEIEN